MDRLRRWLADTETSQTGLAELVGVKQPTVWEWINGDSMPSGKNLLRLSDVTGLSIDELLSAPQTGKPLLKTSLRCG